MPRERDGKPGGGHPALLSADRIGRRAGTRWVFRELSFELRPGSRLGVVGPSGSGKTLLLRALGALDGLDEGVLSYQGQALESWAPARYREKVCYLAQNVALLEGDVEHNLSFPFSLSVRAGQAFSRERATSLLGEFSLDGGFLQTQAAALSGGEAQIVALLRALLLDPLVLLLDEATAHLDAGRTLIAEALVDRWRAERAERCVIWVSHTAEQLDRVCDARIELARPA